MSNHVPTNAASGAVRGGMLGGLIGFLAIPAIAAGVVALGGFGLAAAGLVAVATTIVNSIIPSPINNLAMAAYGAAGFGLFGAANGVDRGLHENVQDQARGAYVNAYAQTRAGIDQMAMQAYSAPEMQMPAPANENTPKPQISAASAEHQGKHQHAPAHAVTV